MESPQDDLHNGVNHNGEEKEMAQGVSIIGNNDLPNGGDEERDWKKIVRAS